LANVIQQTDIFTFDSVQGLQREIIIVDLTVSNKLGFLRDPARLMVALSRPRSMLIIVGNIGELEKSSDGQSFKSSKISQLFEYIKRKNFRVSITGKLAEGWKAPFATADDLGERRIAFVRNEQAAVNLAFIPDETPTYVVHDIEPGITQTEYQPERPQVTRATDLQAEDTAADDANPPNNSWATDEANHPDNSWATNIDDANKNNPSSHDEADEEADEEDRAKLDWGY